MARPIEIIEMDSGTQIELRRRVRSSKTSRRDHLRARIVLLRAEGLPCREVARELDVSQNCVSKWSRRFKQGGINALADEPGRGRKPSITPDAAAQVVSTATCPPEGRTRWSIRSMAKASGMSRSSVQRLWSSHQIKPHRTRTFKVSNDPHFEDKFWDVIGLYLHPPDRALILCCDEKSQCQALERTQRALPLMSGHAKTFTHDYIRHGTLTLFAALDYLEGKVFSRIEKQHTHREWLLFLKQVDKECPDGLTLHVILDNYATHKRAEVVSWMERRNVLHEKRHGIKRIVLHFTPTSSSWMNLVERFFGDITQQALLNDSFSSVKELAQRILDYIDMHNLAPKRYVWKAEGQAILEKIQRARRKLAEGDLEKPVCKTGH